MLSKTSTQVVNALVILAKLPKGQCEGAASIAKEIKAPANYLSKMLQFMCSTGIVESKRGLGGGFRLIKSPDKITLYEVVEPIDKVTVWEGCTLGLKKCSDKSPCAVHDDWKEVKDTYMKFLKTTSIARLVK
ncbi:MAG: Rrf2 family iron-sulfur cluster assembly transcriptional regulator [Candidatus Omnitrophota bacterium]|jgi:Rrf2 family iron-sulfur cluster assembly transcriptional regulator